MPLFFGKPQIQALKENPVYQEILSRIETELKKAEALTENPDPFQHGMGIGAKRALRTCLTFTEILVTELDGKSGVSSLKKNG